MGVFRDMQESRKSLATAMAVGANLSPTGRMQVKDFPPALDHVTVPDAKRIHRVPQALVEFVNVDPVEVGQWPASLARPNKDGLGLVDGRDGFAPDAVR